METTHRMVPKAKSSFLEGNGTHVYQRCMEYFNNIEEKIL